MYGVFTYIWLVFRVNVGKYTIHIPYIWLVVSTHLWNTPRATFTKRHPRGISFIIGWGGLPGVWCRGMLKQPLRGAKDLPEVEICDQLHVKLYSIFVRINPLSFQFPFRAEPGVGHYLIFWKLGVWFQKYGELEDEKMISRWWFQIFFNVYLFLGK